MWSRMIPNSATNDHYLKLFRIQPPADGFHTIRANQRNLGPATSLGDSQLQYKAFKTSPAFGICKVNNKSSNLTIAQFVTKTKRSIIFRLSTKIHQLLSGTTFIPTTIGKISSLTLFINNYFKSIGKLFNFTLVISRHSTILLSTNWRQSHRSLYKLVKSSEMAWKI